MNKFILLIAGTRTYDDYTHFETVVDFVLPKNCEIEIVHGGAKGTDSLANTYANNNGYKCTVFNADWSIGRFMDKVKKSNSISNHADIKSD